MIYYLIKSKWNYPRKNGENSFVGNWYFPTSADALKQCQKICEKELKTFKQNCKRDGYILPLEYSCGRIIKALLKKFPWSVDPECEYYFQTEIIKIDRTLDKTTYV